VIRGGSWNNEPVNLRSANRNRNTPDNRNNNLGFRLAHYTRKTLGRTVQPKKWKLSDSKSRSP